MLDCDLQRGHPHVRLAALLGQSCIYCQRMLALTNGDILRIVKSIYERPNNLDIEARAFQLLESIRIIWFWGLATSSSGVAPFHYGIPMLAKTSRRILEPQLAQKYLNT